MKNIKYIKFAIVLTLLASITTTIKLNQVIAATVNQSSKTINQNIATQVQEIVKPLVLIHSPSTYLNKVVVMNAKFDKFSTLGLDYKPAFKSSDAYISFLIKRDDTSFNIPLSEMKLFMKREMAEKFIDLKTNDEIQIKGTVFSDALGDTWVDVCELKVLKKAPEEKKS